MQLFVNDLTVLDCSYLCPERGMVGESWLVDVLLTGELDAQSMVFDFAHVKRVIKQRIDAICDHRLLVPMQAANCQHTFNEQHQSNETGDAHGDSLVQLKFATSKGQILMQAPAQAYAFIPALSITEHSVAQFLHGDIMALLPENVEKLEITLRAQQHSDAYYHYSHGLKKHDGNCQRIAHGHRSSIQIFKDGKRDQILEQAWAQRWQDIYLATEEDVRPLEVLDFAAPMFADIKALSQDHIGFAYHAPQGEFQLVMPSAACEIIHTDTTVELLALYIQQQLQAQAPAHHFRVVAYEGVQKGAIAD